MKPVWQQVLDSMPAPALNAALKRVLRTRKRYIPIGLNGRTYVVARSIVRDYLREKVKGGR